MEETTEINDQYFDKYKDNNINLDSYYEYLAERDDRIWEG